MQTHDAVLLALLAALVVVVICQSQRGRGGGGGGARDGFCGQAVGLPMYPPGTHNPYVVLNKEIGELRGAKHGGYNQPPIWRQPHGLDRYHRSGARVHPRDIAAAERAMWFAADANAAPGDGGAHELHDAPEVHDVHGAHGPEVGPPGPAGGGMDYCGYITDLVVDPRTRDNHRKWVWEMQPWSGTAMTVDDMDEAMEATVDFTGLRRPQPVAIHNPQQLTERDTYTFISNMPFRFTG